MYTLLDFIDWGTWGKGDFIFFLVLIILDSVLLCLFLGLLVRRIVDTVFPGKRKRKTGISFDEAEAKDDFRQSKMPFYVEDGLLEDDIKNFLSSKGVGTFDAQQLGREADERLKEVEEEEAKLKNYKESIYQAYENEGKVNLDSFRKKEKPKQEKSEIKY